MPRELRKILYIEDEADIQAIAKIALESVGGFEVLVCESGTEAIHEAPEFGPDLILLDVMMPGMDGPDTLEALHRLPAIKDTPAVFSPPRRCRRRSSVTRNWGRWTSSPSLSTR